PGSWRRWRHGGSCSRPTPARLRVIGRRAQRPPGRGRSCGHRLAAETVAQRIDTNPMAPVTEALPWCTLGGERRQGAFQERWDLAQRHVAGEERVQAGAQEVTAQMDVVLAESGAHEADVADVGPCAAVGAAGHPEADAVVRQPKAGNDPLELP